MTRLIAVTGANGWIGGEVCRWLEGQGYGVRRLARTAVQPGTVRLDLSAGAADPQWSEALAGCSAVVHCAAHVHRPLETVAELALFDAVNVGGTAKLVHACRTTGVTRFVLAGSSSVYDWSLGRPMTEEDPVRPRTAYARTKLEAESLVRASGLDWRIARLGTVFGPGDTANFQRLAQALRARRFVLPGRGAAAKSVLPVSRAGELLGRLATERAGGPVLLNLAAPLAPTLQEICTAFSHCCGFPGAPAVPLWLLRGGARLGDGMQVLRLPAPLTTDTLAKLTTPTVLNVTAMQQRFPGLDWPGFEAQLAPAATYYAAR
jgi:UDP-glucose 4-epimerase